MRAGADWIGRAVLICLTLPLGARVADAGGERPDSHEIEIEFAPRLSVKSRESYGGDLADVTKLLHPEGTRENWQRNVGLRVGVLEESSLSLRVDANLLTARRPIRTSDGSAGGRMAFGGVVDWQNRISGDFQVSAGAFHNRVRALVRQHWSSHGDAQGARLFDEKGSFDRLAPGLSMLYRLEADLWGGDRGSVSAFGQHQRVPAYSGGEEAKRPQLGSSVGARARYGPLRLDLYGSADLRDPSEGAARSHAYGGLLALSLPFERSASRRYDWLPVGVFSSVALSRERSLLRDADGMPVRGGSWKAQLRQGLQGETWKLLADLALGRTSHAAGWMRRVGGGLRAVVSPESRLPGIELVLLASHLDSAETLAGVSKRDLRWFADVGLSFSEVLADRGFGDPRLELRYRHESRRSRNSAVGRSSEEVHTASLLFACRF